LNSKPLDKFPAFIANLDFFDLAKTSTLNFIRSRKSKSPLMEKELFLDLLKQNIQSCSYAFDAITEENNNHRLHESAASVGFIFRHVGETMLLFGYFYGIPTDATNTTMGQQDTGQGKDLSTSRELLEKGYALLEQIITSTPNEGWFEPVETPFFGTVSKARLFSHILYHNSYHAGQVALTIKRASK
jgi:uncharacterized damage-inducible protein DinB